MSLEVSVRKFALSDLPRINELEKASFAIDAFRESTFVVYYHEYPDLFIVAETASAIVGYMLTYSPSGEKGIVVSIAVDPSYRRKGVGRVLVKFTFNRLKASGVKKVELRVRTTNGEGIRFWESLGFAIDTSILNFYSDGGEALQMVKELGLLMD